ncbi:MAG: hypothetical protein GXY83_11140 [Rhodopirellula sp.]|nr:hypothetical protein [Rhodopirellula sp.]
MNSVDAAYKVLLEAGKPLHYAEIARRVVQSRLWVTSGKTPENTVNRDINQEIMHRGKLARFVRLGDGMYAAVPQTVQSDPKKLPPELAFVSDAWGHLPIAAKQKVLQIVRAALTGQSDEVDDPVVASVLPDGPKAFPTDFLNGDIGSVRAVELPEEQLAVRQLADGGYVVESHFGFRHDVRNKPEGMFIVYAHARGARALDVPEEMIHLFKAVTGYEVYLRTLWRDLYRAYGRECGDRAAAYCHAKTAFETIGLPVPDEAQPPATAAPATDEAGDRQRKLKRGLRTPETAFYLPILQALEELRGSGRAGDVVRRVGEIMAETLGPDDRKPLPSTGLPRWENTTQFARHSMVRSGLLKSDSRRGLWEISPKGLEHLRRSRSG